jgi:hypothetical protein
MMNNIPFWNPGATMQCFLAITETVQYDNRFWIPSIPIVQLRRVHARDADH